MDFQNQTQSFHRRFRDEAERIEHELERLDAGADSDVVEDLLERVAALSNIVKDAAVHIPAYDQRIYIDALRKLQDQVRSKRVPKAKFSFKNKRKINSEANPAKAEALAPIDPTTASVHTSTTSNARAIPSELEHFLNEVREDRSMPFPLVPSIILTSLNSIYLVMPIYVKASTSSRAYLNSMQSCAIDLWLPTQPPSGSPLPSLHATEIKDSILLCGHVSGPVHITALKRSKLIVACQQLRMHDCVDCEIYLHCGSRPIIEGCKRVSFAPLPECFQLPSTPAADNQWFQIDDFNWLKGPEEPNPHWQVLPEEQRLSNATCQSMREMSQTVIARESVLGSKQQLEEILRITRVSGGGSQ